MPRLSQFTIKKDEIVSPELMSSDFVAPHDIGAVILATKPRVVKDKRILQSEECKTKKDLVFTESPYSFLGDQYLVVLPKDAPLLSKYKTQFLYHPQLCRILDKLYGKQVAKKIEDCKHKMMQAKSKLSKFDFKKKPFVTDHLSSSGDSMNGESTRTISFPGGKIIHWATNYDDGSSSSLSESVQIGSYSFSSPDYCRYKSKELDEMLKDNGKGLMKEIISLSKNPENHDIRQYIQSEILSDPAYKALYDYATAEIEYKHMETHVLDLMREMAKKDKLALPSEPAPIRGSLKTGDDDTAQIVDISQIDHRHGKEVVINGQKGKIQCPPKRKESYITRLRHLFKNIQNRNRLNKLRERIHS